MFSVTYIGKTEHSTAVARYGVLGRVFSTVYYFPAAAPFLKLRMPKVACLQGHNVIGKKIDQVP